MWDSFDQVAQASDGKAKLMCKKCGGHAATSYNDTSFLSAGMGGEASYLYYKGKASFSTY
uniref:Uncharacterized protein n=1 Tax=Talaromyces marneffei PM1 TaxID=1077442 RepID=A0A093UMA3_TALMA